MSLVNEALKRAKEAQEKQAGAPMRGAPLHTAEPPPASKMWVVAVLAFVLAIGGAGGGIWYWQKHQSISAAKTEVPAKPAYQIIMGNNPAAPAPVKITTIEPVAPAPAAAPAPKTETAPVAIVVDNSRVAIIPPIPAPAPPVALKLQGILYSATKPAAILNGRTVFVGDRISGMTVTAIEPDRVTVTYNNQPTVLRMP